MGREPHWCPVEGCDKGPGLPLESVRPHISAKDNDAHDWGALKDEVHGQGESDASDLSEGGPNLDAEGSERTENEQNAAPETESEESDAREGPDEVPEEGSNLDAEGSERTENEQNGDSDMAATEEYDRQTERQTSDPEGSDEGSKSNQGGSIPLPKLSTPVMVLVVVIVAVLLVFYLRSNGSSEESDASEAPEEGSEMDDDETETPLIEN
jgi:hypothetical protein